MKFHFSTLHSCANPLSRLTSLPTRKKSSLGMHRCFVETMFHLTSRRTRTAKQTVASLTTRRLDRTMEWFEVNFHRENLKIFNCFFQLVNEPFSRDPSAPTTKIKARKYDRSPRPSITLNFNDDRRCSSPTPYSQPSIGNLRDKFSSGMSYDDKISKKRSAPKPPSHDLYNDQLEQRAMRSKGPAPPCPVPAYRAPRADPIKELEKIGKKEVCDR